MTVETITPACRRDFAEGEHVPGGVREQRMLDTVAGVSRRQSIGEVA